MMTRITNWHALWFGLGLTLLMLSLFVVWLNIALVDLSYRIEDLKGTVEHEENLNDKLKLERLNLVSSRRLRELSRDLNLHHPETSRIRRLRP
ncbi:MAG: hypothetical protein K9K64_00220 [Desulfohalobiaceae bacterium]|nr:hypothetical protein [Desulfohalobiaceae bacterium]